MCAAAPEGPDGGTRRSLSGRGAGLHRALPVDTRLLLVHAGTLEYLRRGGRIGRAASLVGGVFDIKPLMQLVDGEVTAYAKVRGQKKALAAMERYIDENTTPDDDIFYCLIDAMNDEEPPLVRRADRTHAAATRSCSSSTKVGAVVGTHIGPGSAAFAMIVE